MAHFKTTRRPCSSSWWCSTFKGFYNKIYTRQVVFLAKMKSSKYKVFCLTFVVVTRRQERKQHTIFQVTIMCTGLNEQGKVQATLNLELKKAHWTIIILSWWLRLAASLLSWFAKVWQHLIRTPWECTQKQTTKQTKKIYIYGRQYCFLKIMLSWWSCETNGRLSTMETLITQVLKVFSSLFLQKKCSLHLKSLQQ